MSQYSPVLLKYLKMYQEDPTSRIFAPLAEAYRKMGLLDEAVSICKEGLALHPHFVGGQVALARAYFDLKQYQRVYDLVIKIVQLAPDNIIAQRLLADSSMALGKIEEALLALKAILYLSPFDSDVATLIADIEEEQSKGGGLIKGGSFQVVKPTRVRKLMKLQRILDRLRSSELSP